MTRNDLIGRNLAGVTDQEDFSLDDWTDVDEGALNESMLLRFRKRKEAIRLYLRGESGEVILAATGLRTKYLNRLVRERCMQQHSDGRVYGWRALVPGIHISIYTRKKCVQVSKNGHGTAGALRALLQLEPEFSKRLDAQILKICPDTRLGEIRRPRHAIWAWFIKELRALGYEVRQEWPFNVRTMGYAALLRYIDKLMSDNPAKAAKIIGGPALAKKMQTGDGVDRPVINPFDRVEMDAHRTDGRFVVMIPQIDGGWSPRLIHRLWVIVLLDVTSRAVIGYHLSLNFETNKEDVTRAIKNALIRWQRRNISFSDHAYLDDAGLPSGHDQRYVGLCWNETSVDGALAETCASVKEKLRGVVGSTMMDPGHGFAQRRSKDDRPFIESFFRTLSTRGLQRLSITTGGKPLDKQGRDPAKVAISSEFQLEYAYELLDVLVANYNATPHSGLGYRSPLQMLDFYASTGRLPARYADPNLVQGLLSVRKLCIVRGGFKEGRRPYVNFFGASYSSDDLAQRHDLVGKSIWVINHLEDDARVALATTKDGFRLGVLRAHPPWHRTPHSLTIRRSINSMVRNRRFTLANGGDAAMTFLEFVDHFPEGKLPLHPTYLELQRLLMEHAEIRSSVDVVDAARARLTETESLRGDVCQINVPAIVGMMDGNNPAITKPLTEKTKTSLPALRKAAN